MVLCDTYHNNFCKVKIKYDLEENGSYKGLPGWFMSTFVFWPVLWTVEQFHIFTSVLGFLRYHLLAICATCGTYKLCHALERNGSLWGSKGIFVKGNYFLVAEKEFVF